MLNDSHQEISERVKTMTKTGSRQNSRILQSVTKPKSISVTQRYDSVQKGEWSFCFVALQQVKQTTALQGMRATSKNYSETYAIAAMCTGLLLNENVDIVKSVDSK